MILTADYHTHTVYSHGKGKIIENALVAKEKGLKQIGISDHGFAHPAFGLTKRKIPVVLDPTLLLNKNDYFKIAKKPKNFTSKKYLLVYFLGAIDSETQSEILKVAKENDLEIVSLMGLNNSHYYTSGPSEFVYLFKEASLIFTDSFHGTVFSMIFEKPFFVFERKGRIKMNSRIESILNILKLQERKISSVSEVKDLFATDYKKAKELLNKERKKSIDFLKEALHNYSFNGDYNE